ncbi:Ribosomal L27 family protein [Theileria parva strain Muguga]|uniref:50S ribosomal protein L27 n=1 Tax=Theileria parva TaxID=5875 RepID=Q4N4I9_THEPA|nr:Ribosomal L27 family protein [Theileria parva strain Muguga]EAN32934.1 Ribosomal L27 family protein [Theileria parva strain Muguga]|eukprot:XP_765217.1 hypothetical protein [Theileria parva strain Muguga]
MIGVFNRIVLSNCKNSLFSTIVNNINLESSVNSIESLKFNGIQSRFKTVKVSAYRRPSRGSPTGQSKKANIGMKRLSAEYVRPGELLVKQRKFIAHNPNVTRNRHFKIYPGENVGVSTKTTSLFSLVSGRVKYTHDITRNVKLVNVLPEPPDELLRDDLWRYRTEHVTSIQDNTALIWRRVKSSFAFTDKYGLVNPPLKPYPRAKFLSKYDQWENPCYPDIFLNYKYK